LLLKRPNIRTIEPIPNDITRGAKKKIVIKRKSNPPPDENVVRIATGKNQRRLKDDKGYQTSRTQES